MCVSASSRRVGTMMVRIAPLLLIVACSSKVALPPPQLGEGLAMPPGYSLHNAVPIGGAAMTEQADSPAACMTVHPSLDGDGMSVAMQFNPATALGVNVKLMDTSVGETREVGRALIAFHYHFDEPRKAAVCGQ